VQGVVSFWSSRIRNLLKIGEGNFFMFVLFLSVQDNSGTSERISVYFSCRESLLIFY
jgi:hypothetical protein